MGIFIEWLSTKHDMMVNEYGEISTRWDTACHMCDTPIKKNEKCFFNKDFEKASKRRLVCPGCYAQLSAAEKKEVEKRPEAEVACTSPNHNA